MKTRNKLSLIILVMVLSLSLLTACQPETPSTPAAGTHAGTTQTEKAEEQPQEIEKTSEETTQQEQPYEEASAETQTETSPDAPVSAPAEQKPADTENNPQETQKSSEESSQAKSDDKTSLHIEGAGIENPLTLSLDELKAMKDAYYEDDYFSLNSYGTKEYFHFKGVKIKAILDKAVLKDSATNISFVASDGYKHEMTLEQALKEDYIDEQDPSKMYPVIIAWHENGNDYDANKGAPFRLVIGQKEPGDVNKPQWVQNIARIIIE